MLKQMFVLWVAFFPITSQAQKTIPREVKIVNFTGSGYDLGYQHGTTLKAEIAAITGAWKENVFRQTGRDAEVVLNEFMAYANFDAAIRKWTPDLYEEIRGIADGSGLPLPEIMVLNLLDEFWVYINSLQNHHCSGLGVPAQNGHPGYLAQNMDLENYTDGFQVLMRLSGTEDLPELMILTHPGLIALNGMNETGIGVCVNTLMQLSASASGLPVAFVVRKIIQSTDADSLLSFLQKIPHASGQNYIIGIRGKIYDFEASAGKVVRFNPQNANGTVYHTNHPIVNDDVKPWFAEYNPTRSNVEKPEGFNSLYRLEAVEQRIANQSVLNESVIKATLTSKDNADNPVCRSNREDGRGFTFASIIMTMAESPYIQLTAGPPDESEYRRFDFTSKP